MRPKYFVTYSDKWMPASINKDDVKKLPIAYALAGFPLGDILIKNKIACTDKKLGVLFVPDRNLPKDWKADDDDWYEIPCFGNNEFNVKCFFGYPKDAAKPKPNDLRRPDVQSGEFGIQHPLKCLKLEFCKKFADGNVWEIPVARRFDFDSSETEFEQKGCLDKLTELLAGVVESKTADIGTAQKTIEAVSPVYLPNMPTAQKLVDGHWQDGQPIKEYRNLWELALKVDRLINGTQTEEEREQMPDINSDAAKQTAIRILQVFYNIGSAEASWLEMFTPVQFAEVLSIFCGNFFFNIWLQIKLSQAVAKIAWKQTIPETSSSLNSGSTDETQSTPQTLPS